MTGDFPILRLELKGLGQVMTTAFAAHAESVSKDVERIVKQEIEAFDFDAEVRRLMRPALQQAVSNAIDRALYAQEVRDALNAAVATAIKNFNTGA